MAIKEIEQEFIRPPQPPGSVKWIKDNLFTGFINSILTILLFPAVFYLFIKYLSGF